MNIRSSTQRVRGRSLKERYLVPKASHRRQIDVGDVGPLMAQELRYGKVGRQFGHAIAHQLLIFLNGVSVTQAVKGQRAVVTLVLKLLPMIQQELLNAVGGVVGGHIVRYQQLVAPLRPGELLPQSDGDGVIDGDCADLAAFAFDGDGILAERVFRDGRVDAEALMDAQTGVSGQIKGQDVIVVSRSCFNAFICAVPFLSAKSYLNVMV